MTPDPSLQQRFAPESVCFGCGPANPRGLHIRSYPRQGEGGEGDEGDEVVADFQPEPHQHAFDGVLNGGMLGTLFDCHSNWTAAYHLMQRRGSDSPPPTVTADLHVRFMRPTPIDRPVRLRAHVVDSTDDRATVEATAESDGAVTASCRATFVAVRPGHPAYHRW